MCTGCSRSEMNSSKELVVPETEKLSEEMDMKEPRNNASDSRDTTQQVLAQDELVDDSTPEFEDIGLSEEEYIQYGAAKDDSYYPALLLSGYQSALIEAINENDFSKVEKYLVKDSDFYREQQEYVAVQYAQGVVHTFNSWEFEDFEMVAPDYIDNKLYVKEKITVKYPEKEKSTEKIDYWVYTIIYNEERQEIRDRELWENRTEDE